jgi:hypothetical protein
VSTRACPASHHVLIDITIAVTTRHRHRVLIDITIAVASHRVLIDITIAVASHRVLIDVTIAITRGIAVSQSHMPQVLAVPVFHR